MFKIVAYRHIRCCVVFTGYVLVLAVGARWGGVEGPSSEMFLLGMLFYHTGEVNDRGQPIFTEPFNFLLAIFELHMTCKMCPCAVKLYLLPNLAVLIKKMHSIDTRGLTWLNINLNTQLIMIIFLFLGFCEVIDVHTHYCISQ